MNPPARGRGAPLSDLVDNTAGINVHERGRPISGIAADSRLVEPGFLFIAVPGVKQDGAQFIHDAIARGAVAVVSESFPTDIPVGVASLIKVPNARAALARAAARFYAHQPKVCVAVTGTNGKTSVAAFVRQIWAAMGHQAASIGTVGIVGPNGAEPLNLTTPDPISLHRTVDRLEREGVTHLAFEASSHGLVQHRLDGMRLSAGAFTNISRDHLDYHKDFAEYRAAKLRLFEELLPPGAAAVVCADGGDASFFASAARARKLELFTVGVAGETLTLVDAAPDGYGQRLTVRYAGRLRQVRLPLPGTFQAENALVAAGLAIATGGEPDAVFAALEHITGATGRLEKVAETCGAMVVVDYAHTPDALANALEALRPYVKNRLIVVFGAGGDRDPGKRPLMGAVAAAKADRVIVTDDNPRSEDPNLIRRAILAAAPGAENIGDRALAIATAAGRLEPGDVLLVAGKGHETGQIIGNRTLPFSDHAAIAAALDADKG